MENIKATVSLTVGRATKLGLDYNPLKNEFTALVKNIRLDEHSGMYEGVIKYQGKNLSVSTMDDMTYWMVDGLAK